VKLITHEVGLQGLDALTGVDALCLFVGEDERPLQGTAGFVDWRLCGGLSRVLLEGFFRGAEGETLLLPTNGRLPVSRIFVIGTGRAAELDAAAVGRALKHAAEVLQRAKVSSVALEIPGDGTMDEGARNQALRAHFLLTMDKAQVAVFGGRAQARG